MSDKMSAEERVQKRTFLCLASEMGESDLETCLPVRVVRLDFAEALVAEVTRERDEARARVAELEAFYTAWMERDGNSPGWNRDKARNYGRQAAKYKARVAELEAEVERLRASLRNARHAIADSHANINESRTGRALRALQQVAREIEAALVPQAPPARKEGE